MDFYFFLFKYIFNSISWISLLTLFVTIVTAWVIYQQVKAAKEQIEVMKEVERNQRIPSVEVYMKYSKADKKTYFEFFNFSNIPAFVSINVNFKFLNGRTCSHNVGMPHYRIGPNVKTWTKADFFNKSDDKIIHSEKTEAKLSIIIENALSENSNIKMEYKKEYIFSSDNKFGERWDERTWGFIENQPMDIATQLYQISKILEEIQRRIKQ